MKPTIIRLKTTLGLLLGLSLAFSAHAVDTWTYTGVSGNAGVDSASAGATGLVTTGVYASNTGSSGISGNWSTSTASNTSGTPANCTTGSPCTGAALQWYSGGGLGMNSDGNATPNHAIDNSGAYTEGVLLTFSTSTILTGIDLGYISGDADISVFRYNGTVAPTMNGKGATLGAMNTAGWELVGNYANLSADNSSPFAYNLVNGATNSSTPTSSASSVGSSWWLITAYNTSYGGASNSQLTQGDDFFKLLAVAGTSCGTNNNNPCGTIPRGSVPEPGSLALAGLALGGVFFTRRRKTATI